MPPTVISTDPANAEINVALDKDISAKFSKAMDATTMNVLNFVVKQGAKQVFGTVTYAGTTATFSPATPLTSNTVYTCTPERNVNEFSQRQTIITGALIATDGADAFATLTRLNVNLDSRFL